MSERLHSDGASNRAAPSDYRRGLRPHWQPGQSGNPRGRAPALVDIAALAREHGPKCIDVAAELLDDPDPRIRLTALVALLDRGFGRPVQAVSGTTDMPTILQLMHHEAAEKFSNELLAEREERERQLRAPLVINGEATKPPEMKGSAPIDLMAPALE
jgi:hypothetical protein